MRTRTTTAALISLCCLAALPACTAAPASDETADATTTRPLAQAEPETTTQSTPEPLAQTRSEPAVTTVAAPSAAPVVTTPEAEPRVASQPAPEPEQAAPQAGEKEPVLAYYEELADRVEFLVESDLAREFIAEARALPPIEPFVVYIMPRAVPEGVTKAIYETLPLEAQDQLHPKRITTTQYYETIFGPPLTYARPLDLVATVGGMDTLDGKKIFDFGYGQMGQVRMMAQAGADVVGTDVSSLLAALYENESDVPEVTGSTGKTGSINLHIARWPAGDRAINLVGDGYDLFLARDVLRTGRMDPRANLEPAHRVNVGVYPEYFLSQLNRVLKPDGLAMVYNTGRQGPENWATESLGADIRSPYSAQQWQDAGFELVRFDENDDEAMRRFAVALDLDKGPDAIDPERNVFVRYTLARKVREAGQDDADEKEADDKDIPRTPWGTPIRKGG